MEKKSFTYISQGKEDVQAFRCILRKSAWAVFQSDQTVAWLRDLPDQGMIPVYECLLLCFLLAAGGQI